MTAQTVDKERLPHDEKLIEMSWKAVIEMIERTASCVLGRLR